uniref:SUEL-type lectin domain-containing protein n=1 Tax=Macrostomum lignano TaxID=282301 RepID=A0A1I8GUV5_9PLAT
SVQLTRMQNSHTWQANGSITPPACASLNNELNFLINCTAQQDFNGSTIFQTSDQVFRNCTSKETEVTLDCEVSTMQVRPSQCEYGTTSQCKMTHTAAVNTTIQQPSSQEAAKMNSWVKKVPTHRCCWFLYNRDH